MTSYRKFLIGSSVFVLYSGLANFLVIFHGIQLSPVHWIVGITLLSLPVALKREALGNFLQAPVSAWCLFFVGMGMLGWFPASDKDIALQDLRWRILTVIELALYVSLCAEASVVQIARRAVAATVVVGAVLNLYELMYPDVGFSSVRGRAAGLYMNSNASGIALVLGMILALTSLPTRLRVPFVFVTVAGVAATISRSSIIALLVSIGGFVVTGRVSGKSLGAWMSGLLVVAIMVLLPRLDNILTTMQREGVINKNLEERLDWFSNPTGVSDFSSWERKYMARRAWQEVEDSPFLGGGTGTSWRQVVGAHNQYLTMMQDHGVIGAVMLPLLVLAVSWRAQGDAKIIGILFSTAMLFLGFFSHNLLYQEFYLLPFGLMASMTQLSRSPIREQLLRDFADHDDVHSSLQFGSR